MTTTTPDEGSPGPNGVGEFIVQERHLRKDLGFWGLTAIGFSNIVGSGWLLSAMYAAQTAGPASLISWVAAGVLCALVALVMVELGASRPEGGGTVRWPSYASGRFVGSIIGWSVLLSVGGTAAEITAILEYARRYLPWLYNGTTLTLAGLGVAIAFSILLTALNWFAVKMFARLNNLISVLKILVPLITVVAIFVSGFHPGRLTDHGGFAPYGYTAVLTALASGGIVYSVNGFQAPVDFSGEARNPRRTVPGSVLTGIGLAVLMYLGLQLAFLFGVPESMLGHGWQGVDFTSPFGQLALILNLQWLSSLLYADAVLSPGGSAYVGVAIDARHTYALAKNGLLPRIIMAVNSRSGIPRRALLVNLAVMVVFLLPFGGWQNIVAVMGDMYLLIYAASAVAAASFRAADRRLLTGWVPGMGVDRAVELRGGERVHLLVRLARSAHRASVGAGRRSAVPCLVAGQQGSRAVTGRTGQGRLAGVLLGRADPAFLAGQLQGLRRPARAIRFDRGRGCRFGGVLVGCPFWAVTRPIDTAGRTWARPIG